MPALSSSNLFCSDILSSGVDLDLGLSDKFQSVKIRSRQVVLQWQLRVQWTDSWAQIQFSLFLSQGPTWEHGPDLRYAKGQSTNYAANHTYGTYVPEMIACWILSPAKCKYSHAAMRGQP